MRSNPLLTALILLWATVAHAQQRVYIIDSGVNLSGVTPGADFIDGTFTDCHGHGTAMATISGIPASTITSVRVFDCASNGHPGTVQNGINWVAARAVQGDMVLLAIHTTEVNPPDYSKDAAIIASIDTGVSWVISAGNNADDAQLYSPARVAKALVVAAADGLVRTPLSNYGPTVDVFADNCRIGWCGTSVAASVVAGQVYTFLQANSWAPPAHVINTFTYNCTAWMTNPGPGTTACKR